MEQKLAIAFRAQDWRVYNLNPRASEFFYRVRNFVARCLLRMRVAHDPAFAHLSTSGLELRFYQDDELETRRSRTNTAHNCRKNEGSRDERHVHRHQADAARVAILPDLFRSQITRVGLLQQANPRVGAQSGVHLAVTGVDGDHSHRIRL